MENREKIRVALFGGGGKVGGETAVVLTNAPDMELAFILETAGHPLSGKKIGGAEVITDISRIDFKGTVFVDFTNAESAVKNAELAARFSCPILIGTTGLSGEQIDNLKKLSSSIPIMSASNLSKGINMLYGLLAEAGRKLGSDYQVEIVELHHKWKKDAPSGTAKEMVKVLKDSGYPEVPTHSIRAGDIIGEHQVIFSTEGETITITHRAHSRKAFAQGVIPAVKFLYGAKPGMYIFRDALEAQWR